MADLPLLWAEAPDEDEADTTAPEAEAHVDDTFAARRLRRWLKGMFGGAGQPADGSDAADRERDG